MRGRCVASTVNTDEGHPILISSANDSVLHGSTTPTRLVTIHPQGLASKIYTTPTTTVGGTSRSPEIASSIPSSIADSRPTVET
ncbi:hypothetical protein BO71DRAFT_401574 [Aspergillus ellipticus CBS 707.79]|uniref:Uncharacterized protein n=1 Tax=Aspergillus ellipticus CBS 707.79 TaxID=1448320 RepID=A0A319D2G1_9EURO|nr:hypothetical protein BO71DRAFT_403552 [Aspergillus ellipticus CBS 707.79]PYH91241.1 hypothetical protein BO71DRAFT_401574 [Aspergillus ellipticus CBS 707.79]